MEDKELQELFAAACTAEANRRRQEQLAGMIASQDATKKRPHLWPLWATAAAAGIAVLLMTMPALFRSESAEPPVMVAQVKNVETESQSISSMTRDSRNSRNTSTTRNITPVSQPFTFGEETSLPEEIIPLPEPNMQTEIPSAPQQESKPEQPQRRVHRRSSTRMVTSDQSAPAPRIDYREAIADALCQEESQPITLHTIKIS